jgi:hypothetical protein
VLELHGWEIVAAELTALTKQGRWGELGGLIDDEMLHAVAVVGEPDEVGRELVRRFGSIARSVSFSAPYEHDRSVWRDVASVVAGATPDAASQQA